MRIEFHCPACGGYVTSEDPFRGEVIRCPTCDADVVVPLTTVGPGAVVAGYRIVRKIGEGGMGSVYLAEQTSMGRPVALKVLPPAYTRDQVFLERFLKEIRLQGALSHPHIATAYDAGAFNDIYYLAMEYVEGQDLYDLIEEHRQVEERAALRIIQKAASGLAYAWAREGLIHRDVKPGNIMIAPGHEVKILDLGVAKTWTRSGDTRHPTDESVIGTPHYMSPEQARASSAVDFHTDVYSLGATLYHMVTGQTPFPGDNLVEVVTQQVSGSAPDPRSLNPNLSESCTHLLEVMMARDVTERYEDWDDCLADIGRVLSGHSPLAPHPHQHGSMIEVSPSWGSTPAKDQPTKRSVIPLVAGSTVILGALLAGGVIATRPRSGPTPTTAEPVPPGPAPIASEDAPEIPAFRLELEQRLARLDEVPAQDRRGTQIRDDYRALAEEAWEHGEPDIADRARRQASELERGRSSAVRQVVRELERTVQSLVRKEDYLGAARVFRSYAGPDAASTARNRLIRARQLEGMARDQAESDWQILQDRVVDEILSSASSDSAMALLVRARATSSLEPLRDQIAAWEHELRQVTRAANEVIATFENDIGREVVVQFARGPMRVTISGLGNNVVVGTLEGRREPLSYTFGYRDLAMPEKVGRLARIDTPGSRFLLGLLALEAREPTHAIDSFRLSGGALSAALAERMDQSTSIKRSENPLE